MYTKDEWSRRDDLRVGLEKALSESPLKEALEVCLSEEVAKPKPFHAGSDLLHQKALTGAERDGYFRFFRKLKELAIAAPPKQDSPKAWSHAARPE